MTIVDRIHDWARRQPDKPALIHQDRPVSYASLSRMVEARRRFFAAQALPPGGLAVVLVQTLASAWTVVLGLRAAGLDTICVRSAESARALGIDNPACFVMGRGEAHAAAPPARAPTFEIETNAEAEASVGEIPSPAAGGAIGGHILYTSGTTGLYKKVRCDPAQEMARLDLAARARGNGPGTVNNAIDFGLWTTIGYDQPLSVWSVGGTVVVDQRPDFHQRFFDHGVNKAIILPSSLQTLVEIQGARGAPRTHCAISVSGGFCPRKTVEQAAALVTDDLTVAYGSTECPSIARRHYQDTEDHDWLAPALGRTLEVVDDQDRPLADGEEGALRVRLEAGDAQGYLNDEAASARHFRRGGFYPGDLAVRRPDGRIRILGRIDDVLNIKGQKLPVAPLEQRLQSFLGVDNVCLFAGLDREGREELVVALETDRDPTRFQKEQIAANYLMFERIRIVLFKEFPRTDTGMRKIRRAELRKRVFR
jgi:acyl-coenzyme A synthetase/AMP-(fatty) acid ligase